MELEFLGACREVGKSSLAVRDGDLTVQLDAGMKVHDHAEAPQNPSHRADALVLSHAHLDHSGSAPLLYRNASLPTLLTEPTKTLTSILLEDSEKVAIKRKQAPVFSEKILKKYEQRAVPIAYGEEYEFYNGDSFVFHDAGHILGSALTLFRSKNKSVLYTGDFKLAETRMHRGADLPSESVDALVMESTYAAREMEPRTQLEDRFCASVRETLENGGPALIAAFAVGRAQELLQVLRSHGLYQYSVYLDGMAARVSSLSEEYPEFVKNPAALSDSLKECRFVQDRAERRDIAKRPSIIITTAGMLDGGPVLDYIRFLDTNGNGKLYLTGYQVQGTNGWRLMEEGRMVIDGKATRIQTPAEHYAFSAHASKEELHETAKRLNPQKVFCLHGEEESCLQLASDLKELGFDANAPQIGEKAEV